ncbi:MAG: peptide ABC transporter substrate-binding protein, partial [Gammaproteobacteria bacterium]|nr:peptide ABC transporter substrate-binding protein [Gammaproteobacteria bacterium]
MILPHGTLTDSIRTLSRVIPVLFALCSPACGYRAGNNVESGTRDQILHFGNADEPQELDPHVVTGIPERQILMSLYEGLVSKHPGDLSMQPGVAESWSVSGDRKIYVFHLRRNAKWSNGDPVTARDFLYSWKRALMPAVGNLYAYMFYHIKNAEAFFNGQGPDFGEVGITALDDYPLQVALATPTPFFMPLLDPHSQD